MTTQTIIQAMPFNLGARRPWTQYEVAVIHQALLDGVSPIAPSNQEIAAAGALAAAMAGSPAFNCSYGPAPAVPVNWFYCVGKNWAQNRLDPGLIAAIRSGNVGAEFFSGCNTFTGSGSYRDLFRHNDLYPWYGAIQRTTLMAPPDWICEQRSRTQYIATTGKQLLALLQRLTSIGGARVVLPPQLQQMIEMANTFPANLLMERPITLAVAVRNPDGLQRILEIVTLFMPMILAQMAAQPAVGAVTLPKEALDKLRAVIADYFEDVVMIWAPGQGASLMPIVMGTADVSLLLGIAAAMGMGVPPNLPPGTQQVITDVVGTLTNIFFPGQQPMHGIETQTGPTLNPMVTKTRSQLLRDALPPPPLPAGIVAVNAPLVGDEPPTPDKSPPSLLLIGGVATVVLLAVRAIVRGRSKD